MQSVDDNDAAEEVLEHQVTRELLVEVMGKLDALGSQLNWLCENLASLFTFVQQMGNNGGGLRGMLKMLQSNPPEMTGEK